MDTLSSSVTAGDLRERLSEFVGRVSFAHERLGVTRHGKLQAVLISVEDLELLEELELARDSADFARAQSEDDGIRISLGELRAESGG